MSEHEAPEWAQTLVERLDRLEAHQRDTVRRIARQKPDQDEGATPPESKPATGLDPMSLIRLGELRARVPEKARQVFDSMIESGTSPDVVASAMEAALSIQSGGGDGATPAPTPPPGRAATAAPSDGARHPTSQRELVELSKSDPDAYKAIMERPDFDPQSLPAR